jgi:hypothetical protein
MKLVVVQVDEGGKGFVSGQIAGKGGGLTGGGGGHNDRVREKGGSKSEMQEVEEVREVLVWRVREGVEGE